MKVKAWGKRFCTYCGKVDMYYITLPEIGHIGTCSCGNTDYCDNETPEQIKARLGELFIPCEKVLVFKD